MVVITNIMVAIEVQSGVADHDISAAGGIEAEIVIVVAIPIAVGWRKGGWPVLGDHRGAVCFGGYDHDAAHLGVLITATEQEYDDEQ